MVVAALSHESTYLSVKVNSCANNEQDILLLPSDLINTEKNVEFSWGKCINVQGVVYLIHNLDFELTKF